jgi:hypothetical protein
MSVAEQTELHVRVAADGTVSAETHNVTGAKCLDYIGLLENLLGANTVQSSYTADYYRTTTAEPTEARDELRQQP